jgi:hypothetical protein
MSLAVGKTHWIEANGGFSCEPVTQKVEYKMDFASDKDTTVYFLRNGEKIALVSRYIVLREKSTKRYLAIGDLQGEIITSTVENLRSAFVFDMDDDNIRRIAEKMLTDEYTVEFLMFPSLPPLSFSFTALFGHLAKENKYTDSNKP